MKQSTKILLSGVLMTVMGLMGCTNEDGLDGGEIEEEIVVSLDFLGLSQGGSNEALEVADTTILLDSVQSFSEAVVIRSLDIRRIYYRIITFNPGDLDSSASFDFVYQSDTTQSIFGNVQNINLFVAEESDQQFTIPVEPEDLETMSELLRDARSITLRVNSQISELPAGFEMELGMDVKAEVFQ